MGSMGLVFHGWRVVEFVELVDVLELDELVELLFGVVVHPDVAVVLFVEGLEHG